MRLASRKVFPMFALLMLAFTLASCEGMEEEVEIYGGPTGWTVTEFYQAKFENEEDYGDLIEHYTFRPLESTATLNTTLVSAYESEEPWIGYNWEPTWVMGDYDMVLLEDELDYNEETGAGNPPATEVNIVVTSGFQEDFPELTGFLSNMNTNSPMISEVLYHAKDNDKSIEEAAIWWMGENPDVWSEWVPSDIETKVQDALDGNRTEPDSDTTIQLGRSDWESSDFHNTVAAFIMNYGYGYETEQTMVDTSVMVQSLTQGDIHIDLEMWSDVTPSYEQDIEDGNYHKLTTLYDDNVQGIYIPAYIQETNPGLQTIQDLPDYVDVFRN